MLSTGVQASVRLIFDQLRADRNSRMRTAAFVSGYGAWTIRMIGTGGYESIKLRAGQTFRDRATDFHAQFAGRPMQVSRAVEDPQRA